MLRSFVRDEDPLVLLQSSFFISIPQHDFSILGRVHAQALLIIDALKGHSKLLPFNWSHQPRTIFITKVKHSKLGSILVSSMPPINVVLEVFD